MADVIIDPKWEAVAGADVLIPAQTKVDAAVMDRVGPNLKLIAKPGIGVDNMDIPAATARQVFVIDTPDAPSESTAEHAVALLMAVAERVVVGDMQLRTDRSIPVKRCWVQSYWAAPGRDWLWAHWPARGRNFHAGATYERAGL